MFYKALEKYIEVFDDSSTIASQAKNTSIHGSWKKTEVLTPKQMLQSLTIVFAKVKAGNTSENLLNEIRQKIYSLYQPKKITEKLYNNMMNFKKSKNRMDTIFINSENINTSEPYRLLLNLSYKTN